jgi:hypothetical protein
MLSEADFIFALFRDAQKFNFSHRIFLNLLISFSLNLGLLKDKW